MKIQDFKLERYFAKHEFTARYLLSSSDCDGFPMQYVLEQATSEEIKLWENIALGYTESEGSTALREAILQYYTLNSVENVVVASPGELNFSTMNVLLNADDHVITVSPCYQSLSEVVNSIGCALSYWKPDPSNWLFDTSELAQLIQPNTKLIIINFPHNPTGSYITKEQQDQIITIARQHDLYIFSDEMYHKLIVDENLEELPPICDVYEKGISLWGTSKTLGLAGLRIGWLACQDKAFLEKVISYKDYLSICSNAPSEVLSMIALNHLSAFLDLNLKKIKHNIQLFKNFADQHDIINSFIPTKAGSTAFVGLDIPTSANAFSDHLVEKAGIMTVPAEMFGYSEKYIRIGFGRNNFEETLNVFSMFLDSLKFYKE